MGKKDGIMKKETGQEAEQTMKFNWVEGYTISVRSDGDEVLISANREGLLSLANHLITLAQQPGCGHFHLDEHNLNFEAI